MQNREDATLRCRLHARKTATANKAQKNTRSIWLYHVFWRQVPLHVVSWCINSKRKEGNVMIWRVWNVARSPLHESSLLLKEHCRCMCWLVVSYLGELSLIINNPRHEWLIGLFSLLFDVKKGVFVALSQCFCSCGLVSNSAW